MSRDHPGKILTGRVDLASVARFSRIKTAPRPAAIRKLLRDKQDAVGLAVPGMPIGSAGMDGPEHGNQQGCCGRLLVQADGGPRLFVTTPEGNQMNRKTASRLSSLVASLLSAGLLSPIAHAAEDHSAHHAKASAPAAGAEMTDGEVRKIDRDAGKLTVKHADIKSLDMPAMTMVFQVRDKAMLDKLQVGARIQFQAVSEAGKFVVTELKVKP